MVTMTKIDVKESLKEFKKQEKNLVFKNGKMNFGGRFQELIDIMEVQHSLTDAIEGNDKGNPYRIKKVVLVFENKNGKQKTTTISEGKDNEN